MGAEPVDGEAAGIEMTTGPLGQGIATSVGMAIAAQWFAARYDRPGFELFGYRVEVLCSDGDIMEGVGCEAASVAGHLALGNLCWIYDDNKITIDGSTALTFSDDTARRFEAYGWHVEDIGDVLSLETHFERFVIESLAAADRARDPNVGEKIHFELIRAVPFTRFATTSRNVETKSSRLVAPSLRVRQLRVKVPDEIKDFDVRRRIRPRRPTNR